MRHLHISIATDASVDLHVLSTPPAFVLSQDQTLRSKFILILWSLIFFIRLLGIIDETQEEITHTNLLCLRVKIVERT